MPQSLSKVYVHITFSTKNRQDLIDDNIANELFDYLGGICKNIECNPVQIGGYKNHVHILCILSKKVAQVTLLEELKKSSSKWMKLKDKKYSNFYWQDGYGIFSVNPSEINKVVDYIKNQKKHHMQVNYKNELLAFLKKYDVKYDEKFLWS